MNLTSFIIGVLVGGLVVGLIAAALLRVIYRSHQAERDQLENDFHALRARHAIELRLKANTEPCVAALKAARERLQSMPKVFEKYPQ